MTADSSSRPYNAVAYDRWSSFYDTYPNPTVAMDEAAFPALWRHLRGARVLEIGCGTGRHTRKLVAADNRVTAIDISPGMLAEARRKLATASVTFIEADFASYDGLAPGAFDAVIASLVVEHVRDLAPFFARVASVLRSGGELFLSELHPDRSARGSAAHFADKVTGEDVRRESFPHTEAQRRNAATAAGLGVEEERSVSGDQSLVALDPAWSRYLGLAMIQMWRFRKA